MEGIVLDRAQAAEATQRVCPPVWIERYSVWLPAGSLRQQVASGAFWSILGAAAGQGLSLLATVFCARSLGVAEFGRLGIVLSTVNLFVTFGALGLGMTASKHVAEYRDSQPARAGRIIGMSSAVSVVSGLLAAAVLYGLAPWISREVLKTGGLATDLRLAGWMIFFASINGYQTGALSGLEAFRSQAIANLVRGVSSFPLIVAGAVFGGLRGAVWGYAAASAVNFLTFHLALSRQCQRHNIPISYKMDRTDRKLLWRFSVPVLVAGFSFTPAVWWSNAMLESRAGWAELGVFSAALQWQTIILFVPNALSSQGLSLLSNAVSETISRKYLRLLWANLSMTLSSALLVALPIVLAPRWIMSWYGAAFQASHPALVLVCTAAVVSAANVTAGQVVWSLNATRIGMGLALVRGATLVVSTHYLAAQGATGLAKAYLLTASALLVMHISAALHLIQRKHRSEGAAAQAGHPSCQRLLVPSLDVLHKQRSRSI